MLVTPRTVVNWHRAGFRLYWTWVSRVSQVGGRKCVSKEVRALIFRMVSENPTWGAPRIHGEDSGRPNFHLLQNFRAGASRIHYYIFDLLCCKDRDLTRLPLIERRVLLKSLVMKANPPRLKQKVT